MWKTTREETYGGQVHPLGRGYVIGINFVTTTKIGGLDWEGLFWTNDDTCYLFTIDFALFTPIRTRVTPIRVDSSWSVYGLKRIHYMYWKISPIFSEINYYTINSKPMNPPVNWFAAKPASSSTTSKPHPKASPTAPSTCESTPPWDGTPTTQSSISTSKHIFLWLKYFLREKIFG